jgi:hypothetical protein
MYTAAKDVSADRSLPSVYLINVGVNTAQYSRARSPIFAEVASGNPQFIYVPFYSHDNRTAVCTYSAKCIPFLNPKYIADICDRAHADPDWEKFTYGDNCLTQLRGRALQRVNHGEILLFWGLLCDNTNGQWSGFSVDRRGWYLLGVLRVQAKLNADSTLDDLSPDVRERARSNIHFRGRPYLDEDNYVFVGDAGYSGLFPRAVDLQVYVEREGLIYRVFRSAEGGPLQLHGNPQWASSLRSCRKVLDLTKADDLRRAKQLQVAINGTAQVDIFKDIDLPND